MFFISIVIFNCFRQLCQIYEVFVASLIHELALLLEVKLKHNSLKHAQSLGVVERAHGALKRILKLNSSVQWSDGYRYVDLAFFIYNT